MSMGWSIGPFKASWLTESFALTLDLDIISSSIRSENNQNLVPLGQESTLSLMRLLKFTSEIFCVLHYYHDFSYRNLLIFNGSLEKKTY